MPSPFPGMNPCLEQNDVWHDFHQHFTTALAEALGALVAPRYIVMIDEHAYIHELDVDLRRTVGRPDAFVTPSGVPGTAPESVGLLDAPVEVMLPGIDVERHPFLGRRRLGTTVHPAGTLTPHPPPDATGFGTPKPVASGRTPGGHEVAKGPPKSVALDNDDYSARYVGRTKDGRQFFLTTPFIPAGPGAYKGREFLALYVFDKNGVLLSATVDDLGTRDRMDEDARVARRDQLLASLGEVKYRRIKVAPFKLEIFGVIFGFIPQAPEEAGEDWSVIVEPGDYMCFWPPWSGGDYDT